MNITGEQVHWMKYRTLSCKKMKKKKENPSNPLIFISIFFFLLLLPILPHRIYLGYTHLFICESVSARKLKIVKNYVMQAEESGGSRTRDQTGGG